MSGTGGIERFIRDWAQAVARGERGCSPPPRAGDVDVRLPALLAAGAGASAGQTYRSAGFLAEDAVWREPFSACISLFSRKSGDFRCGQPSPPGAKRLKFRRFQLLSSARPAWMNREFAHEEQGIVFGGTGNLAAGDRSKHPARMARPIRAATTLGGLRARGTSAP